MFSPHCFSRFLHHRLLLRNPKKNLLNRAFLPHRNQNRTLPLPWKKEKIVWIFWIFLLFLFFWIFLLFFLLFLFFWIFLWFLFFWISNLFLSILFLSNYVFFSDNSPPPLHPRILILFYIYF